MRQLRYIASLAIVLLAALPIQAQTENQAFYIYQNDGHFDGFFYDEIEKMTFSFLDTLGVEHDEIVSQEIVTADSTYRIMLSAIDSIGFVQPEITYNPRLHNYQTDVLFNYLRNVSDDYRTFTFFDDLPSNMVPQVGDVFASFDIQSGFSCKVKEVNTIATGIIVQCGEIDDITDIFQHFVSVEEYGGDEQGNFFVVVAAAEVHCVGDGTVALLGHGILGVEGNHLGQIHCIGRAVDDVCAKVGKHGSRFVGHRMDDAQQGRHWALCISLRAFTSPLYEFTKSLCIILMACIANGSV